MKNILLIVGILLAGGSIYWGMDLSKNLEKTGQKKVELVEEKKVRDRDLKNVTDELEDSIKQQNIAVNDQIQAAADLQRATEEHSRIEGELNDMKAQLAQVEKELAEMLAGADGRDPDQMVADANALKEALKEKEAKAAELATVLQGAKEKLVPLESHYAKLQEQLAKYDAQVARNSEEYAITVVEPTWGFVIVNAGQNVGLDVNESLLVTRNGKRQAVLKVTRVDKNQTVADIVQDSIKPGNKLEVGDKVILLRSRG